MKNSILKNQQYLEERRENLLVAVRIASILIFGAFASFAFVDPIFNTDNLKTMLLIRLEICIAVILVASITYFSWGRTYKVLKTLSYIHTYHAGVGVILLTGLSGGSVSPYWTK